jgi:thymidylate synthase (FAD)
VQPVMQSEPSRDSNVIQVLDHGSVRLVDHMGSDLSVVNAARVSFDKRSEVLSKKDIKLIHFLAERNHWSPFAHPQLQFEIKCPMLVKNQWIKHRVGMTYLTDEDAEAWDNEGWNEQSMRYVSPSDFYVPAQGAWRAAPANKKQGSGENLPWREYGANTDYLAWTVERGIKLYEQAIKQGVAPEQARLHLPMYAMYTSFYWTTSLYGVARFLQLRLKEDSQYEIREFAKAIEKKVRPLFPESISALLSTTGV